jgi:hypothetical protein
MLEIVYTSKMKRDVKLMGKRETFAAKFLYSHGGGAFSGGGFFSSLTPPIRLPFLS